MTDDRKTKLLPGIYYDLSFDEYLAIDALNNSSLSKMATSPAHFKASPAKSQSKPLTIGSLTHAGRLEPMTIPMLYAVQPDYHLEPGNLTKDGEQSTSKSTKYVRERTKQFAELNDGKEIVPRDWYDETLAIVTALHGDDQANAILNYPGPVELSIVWEDEATGILCKCRVDKLALFGPPAPAVVADLKTWSRKTSRPAPVEFRDIIVRRGYHRQMAHYQAGVQSVLGREADCWIAAVETSAPYCVMCAPLSEELLAAGRRERGELIRALKQCQDEDDWPGYETPDSWDVPEWYDAGPVEITINGETVTL